MIRSIKILIFLFVAFDLFVAWLAWRGLPLNAIPSYLLADNQICNLRDWLQGYRSFLKINADQEQLAHQSRRTRPDPDGPDFWQTPVWNYWVPRGMGESFVSFVTAQFQDRAYEDGAPIHPGAIVLDLGGFVGDYAKLVIEQGASKVVTVEPSPAALECIRRNLSAEIAGGRVVVIPKGVWDKDDRLFLTTEVPNPAENRVLAGGATTAQGVWIPLTTVDEIVEDLHLPRVDVIKMDVEGAEMRAIRGAAKTLNRFRPVVAVATEHNEDIVENDKNVIRTFREVAGFYKYKCGYCYRDPRKRLVSETLYFEPGP